MKKNAFRKALEMDQPLHILSFRWDDFRPSLTAYDLRSREFIEMDIQELDWRVTNRRICTGRFTDAGYRPCPVQRPVYRFNQCDECGFIPDMECIFDPKCGGDYCDTTFCSREHAVYLAFYGPVPKVGMTGIHRIRERMVEQGADAYTVLALADNRWAARGLEKEIAGELGLRQSIRGNTALGFLHNVDSPGSAGRKACEEFVSRVDVQTLEECAMRFLDSLTLRQREENIPDHDLFDFEDSMKNLEILSEYPIDLPLDAVPVLSPTIGMHTGEVIGLKGKFLIYRDSHDAGLRALQMPELGARIIWC